MAIANPAVRSPAVRELIRVVLQPAHQPSLTDRQWADLLTCARLFGLSGRLADRLAKFRNDLPDKVRDHVDAAQRVATKHVTTLSWEIDRIAAALAPLEVPVVLLKGAAYLAHGLPPSRGRLASDVDIMVPASRLAEVEEALVWAGWQSVQTDDYDQRYFRDWMHELPPLRHTLRNTMLDVHHTILPPTSRVSRQIDAGQLFEARVPIRGSGLYTLSPSDMILHSAVHRLSEGEHPRALRDLVDLHDLLEHFAARETNFCETLVERASALGLTRPLYYALRYCRLILGTRIPEATQVCLDACGPSAPIRWLMDTIAPRAFVPDGDGVLTRASVSIMYVRAHYLRMPWTLLVPHLTRKWLRRNFPKVTEPSLH